MVRGFVYLAAVVDWFSRRVLAWQLSNAMDTSFGIEAVEEAIEKHGRPEIFNTDQGAPFTSEAFTGRLERFSNWSRAKPMLSSGFFLPGAPSDGS
jgi:putative transposase